MTDGHWQLEGSAAELYQRYLVPGITSKWAADLVDRAQLRAGEEVLDVACGTGVVARLAAKQVASGHVTGLDLNAGMLAVARVVSSDGVSVNWMEGSALDLPFPSGRFDAVFKTIIAPNELPAICAGERFRCSVNPIKSSISSSAYPCPGRRSLWL